MSRGEKGRGQTDSSPFPFSSPVSSSFLLSFFPSYRNICTHFHAPGPGLGAQDTEVNPTQSLPSRSSWSQGTANKGKTNNHER